VTDAYCPRCGYRIGAAQWCLQCGWRDDAKPPVMRRLDTYLLLMAASLVLFALGALAVATGR
jgi:hypothetical protein